MSGPTEAFSPKVLLADDDELLRKSLAARLERRGCSCTCVSNAGEAMGQIKDQQFDCLIVDINMPGNERLQFVEQVTGQFPGIPLILLTGGPSIETAARSVRLAVFAYLVKPANLDELLLLIHQAGNAYRQRRAIRTVRERIQRVAEELKVIESGLDGSDSIEAGKAMAGFLQVVVGNIANSITDLEQYSTTFDQRPESGEGLQPRELINALRHTVAVLERTKQSFKSRDLGQLRQQLNALLSLHE